MTVIGDSLDLLYSRHYFGFFCADHYKAESSINLYYSFVNLYTVISCSSVVLRLYMRANTLVKHSHKPTQKHATLRFLDMCKHKSTYIAQFYCIKELHHEQFWKGACVFHCTEDVSWALCDRRGRIFIERSFKRTVHNMKKTRCDRAVIYYQIPI